MPVVSGSAAADTGALACGALEKSVVLGVGWVSEAGACRAVGGFDGAGRADSFGAVSAAGMAGAVTTGSVPAAASVASCR
jgi:hypothetical protein